MACELSDGTICLRAPCSTDIDAAVTAVRASLAELTAWTTWCHIEYSRADVELFLRKVEADRFDDTAYDFYVFDSPRTRLLGGCGLYHLDHLLGSASLGYWVRSDVARQGIATAAARLLIKFGFQELELTRIEILAAATNVASQRVAVKVGAVREGIRRNGLRLHGGPVDAVGFSLIPADFGL
ncbi:MAG TPA: GNAT family protein [Pirellulales bacterium]|jgi:RimJ/RimL family protein N-acetyltransferase